MLFEGFYLFYLLNLSIGQAVLSGGILMASWVDSSAHRTSILILTHFLLGETCCCYAPVVPMFGGSKFNLGGSDCTSYSQQRFQGLEVSRFFLEVPDFEL
jgi:hypothetical protein